MPVDLKLRDKYIVKLYDEGRGEFPSEIARKLNISRERVRQILAKNGLEGDLKTKVRIETRTKLISGYLELHPFATLGKIAEDLDLPVASVQLIAKKLPRRSLKGEKGNRTEFYYQRRREKFIANYNENIVKGEIDECWIWKGPVNKVSGAAVTHYPQKSPAGRTLSRELWVYHYGEPQGWVINTCRNKLCGNPAHLEDLSPREAIRKYRNTRGRPRKNAKHI